MSEVIAALIGPSRTIGATILLCRRAATNVIVFHSPCGTWPISRSPRGQRPLRRTILMLVAVSSINTSRVVSRKPCCRFQRRRARATSARCCSAARRLFFERDAMTIEESPERATAARNPSLVHRRYKLVQRSVRLLINQGKDALGIVFQDRSAATAQFRCTHPLITPTLLTAELGRISKRSAASRRDAPASTASITRSRRSPDSAFGIVVAPTGESMPIDSFNQTAKRIPPIQTQRNVL